MNRIPLFSISALFFIHCQQDEIRPPFNEAESGQSSTARQELQPYFDRFEEEAQSRGLTYQDKLNDLETAMEDITQNGVIGTCTWYSHSPDLVTIDLPFWNNASDIEREYVIFHELGHCILNRGHDESQNTNGVCLSMMASGTGDCQSAYSLTHRDYYLDELFLDVEL